MAQCLNSCPQCLQPGSMQAPRRRHLPHFSETKILHFQSSPNSTAPSAPSSDLPKNIFELLLCSFVHHHHYHHHHIHAWLSQHCHHRHHSLHSHLQFWLHHLYHCKLRFWVSFLHLRHLHSWLCHHLQHCHFLLLISHLSLHSKPMFMIQRVSRMNCFLFLMQVSKTRVFRWAPSIAPEPQQGLKWRSPRFLQRVLAPLSRALLRVPVVPLQIFRALPRVPASLSRAMSWVPPLFARAPSWVQVSRAPSRIQVFRAPSLVPAC
ncbi:hypothetical protein CHARACLAT_011099 [Characodon lateralis]|uniref:Uncharacterized protein n=1 Tax=Characodon lateralis TaxID=208331 RepID=A0ABU7DZJ4_9TELE|nr:hypothetical protein [Characodon lateralis]